MSPEVTKPVDLLSQRITVDSNSGNTKLVNDRYPVIERSCRHLSPSRRMISVDMNELGEGGGIANQLGLPKCAWSDVIMTGESRFQRLGDMSGETANLQRERA